MLHQHNYGTTPEQKLTKNAANKRTRHMQTADAYCLKHAATSSTLTISIRFKKTTESVQALLLYECGYLFVAHAKPVILNMQHGCMFSRGQGKTSDLNYDSKLVEMKFFDRKLLMTSFYIHIYMYMYVSLWIFVYYFL